VWCRHVVVWSISGVADVRVLVVRQLESSGGDGKRSQDEVGVVRQTDEQQARTPVVQVQVLKQDSITCMLGASSALVVAAVLWLREARVLQRAGHLVHNPRALSHQACLHIIYPHAVLSTTCSRAIKPVFTACKSLMDCSILRWWWEFRAHMWAKLSVIAAAAGGRFRVETLAPGPTPFGAAPVGYGMEEPRQRQRPRKST
jgi:hypothetical protein